MENGNLILVPLEFPKKVKVSVNEKRDDDEDELLKIERVQQKIMKTKQLFSYHES